MTKRQATNHVGHEAQLLVRVVLLVLEILVGLVQTLLLQRLLLPAISVLQLVDVHALTKLLLAERTHLTCASERSLKTLEAEASAVLFGLLLQLLSLHTACLVSVELGLCLLI